MLITGGRGLGMRLKLARPHVIILRAAKWVGLESATWFTQLASNVVTVVVGFAIDTSLRSIGLVSSFQCLFLTTSRSYPTMKNFPGKQRPTNLSLYELRSSQINIAVSKS